MTFTLSPTPDTTTAAWHSPPLHVPPRQSWPQEPQFLASVARTTQELPQVVLEQPQLPDEQVFPFAHAVWFCQVPLELHR